MSRPTTAEAPDDVDDSPLTILELFGLIKSKDENDRLDGLAELSDLVDSAYGDDGAALGEAVRAVGGLPLLGWLIVDPSPLVQQEALLILGNLCSDACDPNSALTKKMLLDTGAHRAIIMAIGSPDPTVLLYACGALQNLCHDDEWARLLISHKVQQRLESLVSHEDARVGHYAAGALKNMLTRVGQDASALSSTALEAVKQRDHEAKVEAFRYKRARALRCARARALRIILHPNPNLNPDPDPILGIRGRSASSGSPRGTCLRRCGCGAVSRGRTQSCRSVSRRQSSKRTTR